MPKRDAAPVGAPCWIDLFTSDPDKSRTFYGELFGWTSEDAGQEFGHYINFKKDGLGVAGAMRNEGQGGPDVWSIYLATDNIKAVADAATEHGGSIIVPPMDVADLGSMCVVTDPGQAAIGAWQPGLHKGFEVLGEPGTPGWFELFTRDYDAAVQFYKDVFKWNTNVAGDTPEFRYTVEAVGDEQFAGVMDASSFLPKGVPAHWSVYFAVADADATVDQVAKLGGQVVAKPEDTPYGRLATVTDSGGVQFKLVAGGGG